MILANWISSNPDAAVAIATTIGGFIWNKIRGKKADDQWELFMKLGRQVLPSLLQDAKLYDDAYVNAKIRSAILAGLARLKVPSSPIVLALVDEAVEHIHGELAEQVMNYNLGQFIKVQGKNADTIKALPEDKPIDQGSAPA